MVISNYFRAKHVGTLNAERKGKVRPTAVFRTFRNLFGGLDRHDSEDDFRSGQEPRGSQLLSAVERLTVKDNRFIIEVRDQKKPLELFLDDAKEFKQWTQAFQQVLAKSLGANFVKGPDSGHASASVSGTTTPGVGHAVLCEGELMVKKKNKEEPRYCVLRTDYFQCSLRLAAG
ncbi:unnamed protein product [Cladocopium goreaui]|uniref:Desumoylating isopeptidase 2 n=1 Tax=Cladocopium goreaui TaxID=2562237 RepID=A0A9P1D9M9_9DINO|nr:unnamed protein product [Cladocopium goreaui]